MFFKSDIQNKQKKKAGMLATEVRSGDTPKPKFPMKTYEEKKGNPAINPR